MPRHIGQEEVDGPVGLAQDVVGVAGDEVRRLELSSKGHPAQTGRFGQERELDGGGRLQILLKLPVRGLQLLVQAQALLLKPGPPDCIGLEDPQGVGHGADLIRPAPFGQVDMQVSFGQGQHAPAQVIQRLHDPPDHHPGPSRDHGKSQKQHAEPQERLESRMTLLSLQLVTGIGEEAFLELSPRLRDLPGAPEQRIGLCLCSLLLRLGAVEGRQELLFQRAIALIVGHVEGGQLEPDRAIRAPRTVFQELVGQFRALGIAADLVPGLPLRLGGALRQQASDQGLVEA